ncbi:MAG: M20 metallopeptidase family protein [Aminivibrio sp.]
MTVNFKKEADLLADWLTEIRRDFHRFPEPSFGEVRTAKIISEFLEEWGYSVSSVGRTGVKGVLRGEPGTKAVAVRADMDGLPIGEETGAEYASSYPGMMHACGHDIHMACALGAAKMLAEARKKGALSGTVVMLFQPAEEINQGAAAIIKEGALTDPDVNMIFGLHNHPSYPAGTIVVKEGPMMAAVDTLKMRISGTGSHGAIPHMSADPVVAAASVVMNLQTVVSRNVDPQDSAVLSFGTVRGGTADNVIPEHIEMTGTIRSFLPEVRDSLHERIARIAASVAEGLGCRAEVEIRRDLPAVSNDEASYSCCIRAAQIAAGAEKIIPATPSMGGEDFALFQQVIPGCMFWLGVGNEAIGAVHPWHSPKFTADETALPVGAAVLAQAAFIALGE